VLYAGGNVIFKSEDRGRTWKPISPDLTRNDKDKQQSSGGPVIKDNSGAEVYDTVLIIAPSEKDPNVIWAGTDDGQVQVTRDGGGKWTNVTDHIPGVQPWGRIESIDLPPGEPGSALIAIDRHFSGDFKPYLFKTSDYGATWQSITGDLPAVYAHVVRRDLKNPRMYYAGLENGLYVSWDAGEHWLLFGLGLPDVSVYDMALNAENNSLVVATHGRSIWILDDLAPFQQFTAQTAKEAAHLFTPPVAVRFWPWTQVEPLGDGAFYGKNPAYGAEFSYYLAHESKDPGTLVIKDAQGKVVRTMTGTHTLDTGETAPEDEDLPPAAQAGTSSEGRAQRTEQKESQPAQPAPSSQSQQQLTQGTEEQPKEIPWVPAREGLQRAYWDLRADGPVRWDGAKDFEKGPRSGALVPPGDYTAVLTVGGQTLTEKLVVVNDPLSHGTQAEMEERYQAAQSVLHELSQVDSALNRLDGFHLQLTTLRQVAKGTGAEKELKNETEAFEKKMKAVHAALTSGAGAAESTLRVPDEVHEKLLALAALLEGEDDAPTAAVLEQKKLLDPQCQSAIQKFNAFLDEDVKAFNGAMAAHSLTGLVAGEKVER
jgi:hypothetical protein